MNKKMITALLVTWKISGTIGIECPKDKQPDPLIGICFVPFQAERSQTFDNPGSATSFAKTLKSYKSPAAVSISDVHIYSEEGAK